MASHAIVQRPREPSTPVTMPPETSLEDAFDNGTLDWATDFHSASANTELTLFDGITDLSGNPRDTDERIITTSHASSSITSGDNSSSLGCDLTLPTLDFGTDETSQYPLQHENNDHSIEASTRISLAVEHSPQPQPQRQPKRNINSHCVLRCTHIISNLEDYILAELKALDLTLGVVRQTVEKLNQLVDIQQESRSFRCMALFSVIMYQIIELLEVGCAEFLAEGENSGLDDWADRLRGNSTSSLGFGAFRMNEREQRLWRIDILVKELQQSWDILQRIINIARLGPHEDCQGTSEDRVACYRELEARFKALGHKVERYK